MGRPRGWLQAARWGKIAALAGATWRTPLRKAEVRLALAITIAVMGAAACSLGATVAPSEEATMSGFALTSPAFSQGGAIPSRYTCDGQDVSPALTWAGAPLAAQSLALTVEDPDARGFIHWIVYNIPPGPTGSLREALHPDADPPQGRNDFGHTGYGGPCPPSGVHRYVFTMYALSSQLAFGNTPTAPDLQRAISGKVLDKATLTGTYTRQR